MKEVMLTTIDNPYNPFTDWDSWYLYDNDHGYDSCGLLARIAHVSDSLSKLEYVEEVERAIDEILKHDLTGKFVKVTKNINNDTENATESNL